jgi:hypothetical protein
MNGDAMTVNETMSKPVCGDHAEFDSNPASASRSGDPGDRARGGAVVCRKARPGCSNGDIKTTLELDYAAARARTEHLTFTLALDSQPMLSDDRRRPMTSRR